MSDATDISRSLLGICSTPTIFTGSDLSRTDRCQFLYETMALSSDFETLCSELAADAGQHMAVGDWPLQSLNACGHQGLFYDLAGVAPATSVARANPVTPNDQHLAEARLSPDDQMRAWIQLAKSDLVTTFVITQHLGAIKRILTCDQAGTEASLKEIATRLLSGEQLASVGISHLTTSRRHLKTPVVAARCVDNGYVLNGTIPWVTGAKYVQKLVVGACVEDKSPSKSNQESGDEILLLLDTDRNGIQPGDGAKMIAMSASCTDSVHLKNVRVERSQLLSGPRRNVLQAAPSITSSKRHPTTGAGGLQTSALALGLSYAALDFLRTESDSRGYLCEIVEPFAAECAQIESELTQLARGKSVSSPGEIRARVNALALRVTGAAMTTAKGAGLMEGHPVARWCQQAFFFLVWSCPQPVAQAHLCELAGLDLQNPA